MSNNNLPPQQESASPLILLAEDEEAIAKLVSFKLGKEGFTVVVAPNGKRALELLPERAWSLVILDVMMPLLDGWGVLKEMRSTPALRSIPVLMLTAKGFQKDMASAAELGAEHYLKKPFDPAELARLVRRLTAKEGAA